MSNPIISILVPVYNVEKYLTKCIESVLNQHFQEWEMIIVDDGSSDKSGEIANFFANKDQRIRVNHQHNQGVSAARNAALDIARGKWIWFVDSDDYITENALSILLKTIDSTKCDTLFFSLKYQHNEWQKEVLRKERLNYDKKSFLEQVHCYVNPSMLFSNEIIQKHSIRFNTKIRMAEDLEFQYKYLTYCHKPASISPVLYVYQYRPGSATNNPQSDINNMRDCLHVVENLYNHILTHKKEEEVWLSARIRNLLKSALQSSIKLSNIHRHQMQKKLHLILKQFNKIGYTKIKDNALCLAAFNINLYILCMQIFHKLKDFRI